MHLKPEFSPPHFLHADQNAQAMFRWSATTTCRSIQRPIQTCFQPVCLLHYSCRSLRAVQDVLDWRKNLAATHTSGQLVTMTGWAECQLANSSLRFRKKHAMGHPFQPFPKALEPW